MWINTSVFGIDLLLTRIISEQFSLQKLPTNSWLVEEEGGGEEEGKGALIWRNNMF